MFVGFPLFGFDENKSFSPEMRYIKYSIYIYKHINRIDVIFLFFCVVST